MELKKDYVFNNVEIFAMDIMNTFSTMRFFETTIENWKDTCNVYDCTVLINSE